MVLALGADVEVGRQVGLEDRLTVTRALDPKAVGANPLLGGVSAALGVGVGFVIATLSLEPGHQDSLFNLGQISSRPVCARPCSFTAGRPGLSYSAASIFYAALGEDALLIGMFHFAHFRH